MPAALLSIFISHSPFVIFDSYDDLLSSGFIRPAPAAPGSPRRPAVSVSGRTAIDLPLTLQKLPNMHLISPKYSSHSVLGPPESIRHQSEARNRAESWAACEWKPGRLSPDLPDMLLHLASLSWLQASKCLRWYPGRASGEVVENVCDLVNIGLVSNDQEAHRFIVFTFLTYCCVHLFN